MIHFQELINILRKLGIAKSIATMDKGKLGCATYLKHRLEATTKVEAETTKGGFTSG